MSTTKTEFPKWVLLATLLLVALGGGPALAQADDPAVSDDPEPVNARVVISQDRVRPGDTFWVAVIFHIGDEYHLYGAGVEGLLPLTVRAKENPHLSFGSLRLPEPEMKKDEALDKVMPIYEGTVVAVVQATASQDLSGESLSIEFEFEYQACTSDFCGPPQGPVAVVTSVPAAPPGAEIKLINKSYFKGRTGDTVPPSSGGGGAGEKPVPPGNGGGVPSDGNGQPPGEDGTGASQSEAGDFEKTLTEKGVFWALLVAFAMGLFASASPCVYPMIPITVSYFGSQGGEGRNILPMAIVYVLGICLTYTILGMMVAILAGKIQMGTALQHPAVLIGIAALFVALAFSMFGLYEIRLPTSLANKLQGGSKKGYGGALFMGLVLGFVAAPCVGPFLASILIYVATTMEDGVTAKNLALGSSNLFAFGLGMGLPFLGLAVFSGKMAAMPRAGPWMEKVKSFFGLVMIGVALYFVSLLPGVSQFLVAIIAGALLVVMGVFLGAFRKTDDAASWPSILTRAGGILLILLGGYLFVGSVAQRGFILEPLSFTGGGAVRKADWLHPQSDEEFDNALGIAREQGKPLVVDIWATWCAPCKIMDKTVFRDPDVIEEMQRFVAVKLDATTDGGPGHKIQYERFKAFNLPYITFFDSQGNHLAKKSVGKVSKEEFLKVLRSIP